MLCAHTGCVGLKMLGMGTGRAETSDGGVFLRYWGYELVVVYMRLVRVELETKVKAISS